MKLSDFSDNELNYAYRRLAQMLLGFYEINAVEATRRAFEGAFLMNVDIDPEFDKIAVEYKVEFLANDLLCWIGDYRRLKKR